MTSGPEERRTSSGDQSPGHGGDYDPNEVQLRQAATVLILDERPDLHVLMLKRNRRSVFVGDMWVFPGGAVDPGDRSEEIADLLEGWTGSDADARVGENGAIGYWVAALRETFEEAGLLLAGAAGSPTLADPAVPSLVEHRQALNDGEGDFAKTLGEHGLRLRGSGMHYVSRWVTPLGPPRRYDTRFFVTARPSGQVAAHDNDEAVHHEWVRAEDAVRANEAGEMLMMTPTVAMLQRLATFGSIDEAMASASAASTADDEWVRIRYDVDGPFRVAFPNARDYELADAEAEHGVVSWPAGSLPPLGPA